MAKSHLKYVIGANTSQAEKAFNELGNKIKRFGSKFESFGKAWSTSITVPLVAIGTLSGKAALDVQSAMKTIRISSGASGEALKNLQADFKAIAAEVPNSFDQTAKAIADFNTMTGATGETLQELSKNALDLSRMVGSDLSSVIDKTTKAMNAWGISAQRGVGFMDKLLVASQNTNVGVDRLADSVSKYGPAFQSLGFEVDEAIAIIGQLEKEGVQADAVMGSLNRTLARLAKAGVKDAGQAFAQITDSIKNAKTEQEAMQRATEAFGQRVSVNMVHAIRAGKFEIDDLVKALRDSQGAIQTTAKETDNFAEQWQRTKNALTLALEPLGTKVLKVLGDDLETATGWLKGLNFELGETTTRALMYTAVLGPATWALGKYAASFSALIKALAIVKGLVAGPGGAIALILGLGAAASFMVFKDAKAEAEELAGAIDEVRRAVRGLNLEQMNVKLNEKKIELARIVAEIESLKVPDGVVVGVTSPRHKQWLDSIDTNLGVREAREGEAKKIEAQIAEINDLMKNREELDALEAEALASMDRIKRVVGDVLGDMSWAGGGKQSAVEQMISRMRDEIKYRNADAEAFLPILEKEKAKLKFLSDDWKRVVDFMEDINKEASGKFFQMIDEGLRFGDLNKEELMWLRDGLNAMQNAMKDSDVHRMGGLYSEKFIKAREALEKVNREIDRFEQHKWHELSWDFAQGFLKADEYAMALEERLAGLETGTGKWRDTFAELQSVMGQMAQKEANKLNELLKDSKISTDEWAEELEKLLEKYGEFPNIVNYLKELGEEQGKIRSTIIDLNELTTKWVQDFQDGLADAIIKGKDFGDVLSCIGAEIAKMALKAALFGNDGMGGLFGSFFSGLLGSAKGNVFSGGHVIPFAKGGVVPQPTIFPMANGTGLMAEDGAEAIMPLTRDVRGRLGVRANGMTTPDVIVNVENRTSTPVQADQVGFKYNDMKELVVGIVLEDQATNGPITRNYRGR